jgi:hypothetical protein
MRIEFEEGMEVIAEHAMQNLADSLTLKTTRPLTEQETAELGTFVVFNERRYVTSSAKRIRKDACAKVAQTPEGARQLLPDPMHDCLFLRMDCFLWLD